MGSKVVSRSYPRKAEIERLVSAAQACGVEVAAIEISADGKIRISRACEASAATSDFERWEAEGRL